MFRQMKTCLKQDRLNYFDISDSLPMGFFEPNRTESHPPCSSERVQMPQLSARRRRAGGGQARPPRPQHARAAAVKADLTRRGVGFVVLSMGGGVWTPATPPAG
jgi:hypothetical protein